MRLIVFTVIFIFLCFLIYQAYIYYNKVQSKKAEYQEIKSKFGEAQKNYEKLKNDLNYYLHTENLIKEIKKRFNYKLPTEKLIILVPQNNETSTSQQKQ